MLGALGSKTIVFYLIACSVDLKALFINCCYYITITNFNLVKLRKHDELQIIVESNILQNYIFYLKLEINVVLKFLV